jgi:O-Antigen ligase
LSTVAAPPDPRLLSGARARRLPRRPGPELLFGTALAAALTAVALRGGGGLSLNATTKVEMALDVAGGLLAALAALAVSARRAWGAVTVGLFGALAVLTALSITWAIQPSDALSEANRTLSYLMVFASGAILARTVGAWWAGLLGGILASTTAICLWAILTKVFPGALASEEIYARLREPFDYWNAVGLTAALGVPAALWLGARRSGHAAVNALAYPILGVQLLTVLLAYSRGSLLALAVGLAFWFLVVPLRLRGVAVLAVGAVGALAVTGWVFAQDTLTKDKVSIDERATSGHELGVLVLVMMVVLLAVGLALGFAAARRAPSQGARRRAGAVILVGVALVPVVVVVALAMSTKGLGGSISDGWKSLTDPNDQSTVLNDPSRLTSVGSVRARYWDESIKIFRAHPAKGVGAGGYKTARLRYRKDHLTVGHSHGYVVQTAADLGALGLGVSGLLLLSWLVAAGRTLGWRVPQRRRRDVAAVPRTTFGPEHVAMATLATIVLVFGVHSFVDWTWFVPGTAVLALVAAGWIAARGPLDEAAAEPGLLGARVAQGVRRPERVGVAVGALAIGILAALVAWQPLRSDGFTNDALAVLDKDPAKALAYTQKAQDANPLSTAPLLTRALVEVTAQRRDAARAALVEAVRLQPSNPETWEYLSRFTVDQDENPALALRLLGPALYLDPQSPTGVQDYLAALRLAATQAQEKAAQKAAAKAKAKEKADKKRKKKG